MDKKSGKLQLINQGSNSQIYLYGSESSQMVLKVVTSAARKQIHHLKNQYQILKCLSHPNIIKLLKYQENITLKSLGQQNQIQNCRNVLVIEYARYGSLLHFIRDHSPTPPQSRWIFRQLCSAVAYLHRSKFVHRDLKLENVLVTSTHSEIQIKLADFGFASEITQNHLNQEFKGTKKSYMAPQIHSIFQSHQPYNTLKADIFALGVIMFGLVVGQLPFLYAKPDDPRYNFLSAGDPNGFWNQISGPISKVQAQPFSMIDDFKELFAQMVDIDPEKRPNIEEVLESDWVRGMEEKIGVERLQG